jgi:hypothetical protein
MLPALGSQKASRLEQGLLLAALLFYALALPLCSSVFRPGFCVYDEEALLNQVQAWREGGPLYFRFGWSSLYRNLEILLVSLGGPHLSLLRLPALAAVLLEALLLFVWLRKRLGERAALWAALAVLVCTATFIQGGTLICVSLMPALFLAQVLACEGLDRPWQAALWGLCAALTLLDYEGWVGALLFLAPYAAWRWRSAPGLLTGAALGAAAGMGLILHLSPDLAAHLGSRRALSSPADNEGYLNAVRENVLGLLGKGDRFPFSAAAYHPWPAPWTWPLTLLGAAAALRRFPWLLWLLCAGGLALGLQGTFAEPHRLCLSLLALGAMAGAGASVLWRWPWGRVLCLALLCGGALDEGRAWMAEPPSKLAVAYGTSDNMRQAVDWLSAHEPAQGWDVIDGLGSHGDGAFRFLLDQAGLRKGRVPVALIYSDFRPALNGLPTAGRAYSFGTYRPLLLFLPSPVAATRLRAISGDTLGLRAVLDSQTVAVSKDYCARWLQDPAHKDPWSRTVYWEHWLWNSLMLRQVDQQGVLQMLGEPLVSGWAPDVLAHELAPLQAKLALRFEAKSMAIDPSRRALTLKERISRF